MRARLVLLALVLAAGPGGECRWSFKSGDRRRPNNNNDPLQQLSLGARPESVAAAEGGGALAFTVAGMGEVRWLDLRTGRRWTLLRDLVCPRLLRDSGSGFLVSQWVEAGPILHRYDAATGASAVMTSFESDADTTEWWCLNGIQPGVSLGVRWDGVRILLWLRGRELACVPLLFCAEGILFEEGWPAPLAWDAAGDLFWVEKQIQDMGFRTENSLKQFKEMRTVFLIMKFTLGAIGTVALVVAGLGIINTMLMAVLERYREIGTYKALGASDGDIRLLFLAEAGLVGLLGGVGGLALGRGVALLIEIGFNAFARSNGIEDQVVAFSFPLPLLGGAMLFAVVVSLVSGVYPAARAARVDPIRALRAE